jgi:hypothetical protein
LQQIIEEIFGVYVSGEQCLMTALISRAINDDSVDTDDLLAMTSSVVDDSFYIFKKAIDRAILTGDQNCACAVLNNITTILQTEYKDFLDTSFVSSKRIFSYCINQFRDMVSMNALGVIYRQRREESNGARITSKDSVPHAIGNIATSYQYVVRFRADCLQSFETVMGGNTSGVAMFNQCLLMFDSISSEMNDMHVNCIKFLLQQLRGSYIAPFVNVIDNVNFDISDIQFSDYQVNDPYMRAFVASLDSLVRLVESITTGDTFKAFISILCDYVALRMERSLTGHTSSKFSLLGASQFYQDIARLVSFFAQRTEVPVRNKFGKLQELCGILCVESVAEFRQIYSQPGSLKVSMAEAKNVLSLRSDITTDAISTI